MVTQNTERGWKRDRWLGSQSLGRTALFGRLDRRRCGIRTHRGPLPIRDL